MSAATEPRTWTVAIPAPIPMKSANVRDHWRVVARERRKWREAAFGRIALARPPQGLARIRVEVVFHFNTNRRRDAPNYMESVIKPCVDAIGPEKRVRQDDGSFRVDRGWGVVPDDTAEFVDLRPPTLGEPVPKGLHPHGLVVLTITDLSQEVAHA